MKGDISDLIVMNTEGVVLLKEGGGDNGRLKGKWIGGFYFMKDGIC